MIKKILSVAPFSILLVDEVSASNNLSVINLNNRVVNRKATRNDLLKFNNLSVRQGVGFRGVFQGGRDLKNVTYDNPVNSAAGMVLGYKSEYSASTGSGMFISPTVFVTVAHNFLDPNTGEFRPEVYLRKLILGSNSWYELDPTGVSEEFKNSQVKFWNKSGFPKDYMVEGRGVVRSVDYMNDLAVITFSKPMQLMSNYSKAEFNELASEETFNKIGVNDRLSILGYPGDNNNEIDKSVDPSLDFKLGYLYQALTKIEEYDKNTGVFKFHNSSWKGFSGSGVLNVDNKVVGISQFGLPSYIPSNGIVVSDNQAKHKENGGLIFTKAQRDWLRRIIEENKVVGWRTVRKDNDEYKIYFKNDQHLARNTSMVIDGHNWRFDGSGKATDLGSVVDKEKERLEKEKAERDRLEKERLEREKAERVEKERLERERVEKEKREKERLEREKAERERLEREKVERERLEKERLEREKAERERLEKERLERERREREEAEFKVRYDELSLKFEEYDQYLLNNDHVRDGEEYNLYVKYKKDYDDAFSKFKNLNGSTSDKIKFLNSLSLDLIFNNYKKAYYNLLTKKEVVIPFETKYVEDDSLNEGVTTLKTKGENGLKIVIPGRVDNVIKKPVDEVINIGTMKETVTREYNIIEPNLNVRYSDDKNYGKVYKNSLAKIGEEEVTRIQKLRKGITVGENKVTKVVKSSVQNGDTELGTIGQDVYTESIVVDYKTEYVYDKNLKVGETKVVRSGKNGYIEKVYTWKTVKGYRVGEAKVVENVIVKVQNEIVKRGI